MSDPAIKTERPVIRPEKDTFIEEENPFEAMMERSDHADQLLKLDPGLYKVLRNTEKQIITSVPIVRDNGEVEVYTGYRVLYNTSRGPAKGGIRFDLFVTREALARLGMSLKGARVAIQGFGNVGSVSADLLSKEGAVVVAVSDKSGGLHRPQGLDIGDVLKWVRERRQLAGYPQADAIPNDQVLTLDCDGVVPAATAHVITRKNAPHIEPKIICEGGNGRTTAAADEILEKKGIFVIPDILANAGGVTVSYFEWVQDRGGYFWDEETVNRRLESIMVRSFSEVVTWAERHKVN